MQRTPLWLNVRFLQYTVLLLAALASVFLWLWVRASDENRRLRQRTEERP